jgi:hypothetical protein
MDPLSALSVAASVVQFVSFTADVVKLINEAANSTSGVLPKHEHMNEEAKKLLDLNSSIQQVLHPDNIHRPLTHDEENLQDVCVEVHAKAEVLLAALADLELNPPAKTSAKKNRLPQAVPIGNKPRVNWRHVQQVIKAVWHQKDIKELQERLKDSKEMLMMTILVSLRYANFICG